MGVAGRGADADLIGMGKMISCNEGKEEGIVMQTARLQIQYRTNVHDHHCVEGAFRGVELTRPAIKCGPVSPERPHCN